MNILVVPSKRSWEVLEPLSTTSANISTMYVDTSDGYRGRFYGTLRSVRSSIKDDNIDVILLDVFGVPGIAVLIAAFWENIPVMARVVGDQTGEEKQDRLRTEFHNRNIIGYAKHWLRFTLTKVILRNAEGVIVVSEELKSSIVSKAMCSSDEASVIPVPHRGNMFFPKKETERRRKTVLLTVTNLKYWNKFKGVREILLDIKELINERDDIKYIIAGGGEYRTELLDFVDKTFEKSAKENIEILGYVEDVVELHDKSDIFIYISYLDGYPNAVLEAQAMKTPVVTNREVGMKDQVEHMKSGIFVDPSSRGEISNVVISLIENDSLGNFLARNAREQVLERNSMESVGQAMVRAMDTIQ